MSVSTTNNGKSQRLSEAMFLLIGLWSFGYLVAGRYFAELNIQVSFLSFPIFVGEILLGMCLILLFLYLQGNRHQLPRQWLWFVPFMTFVVIKAVWGYSQGWGGMALRHSALFYYSLFLLMGYVSFRPYFFNDATKSFLIMVLIIMLRLSTYFRPHTFVVGILLAVLLLSIEHRKLKAVLMGVCLISFNYSALINCSRTEFVGAIVSSIILFILFFGRIQWRLIYKVGIFGIWGIVLVAGIYSSANVNNIMSLVQVKSSLNTYRIYKQVIEEGAKTFSPKKISVLKLYNNQVKRDINYNQELEQQKSGLLMDDIRKVSGWEKGVGEEARGGIGTEVELSKDSGNKGASASDLFVRAPKEAGVKVGGNPSRDLENNIASPAPFPAQVGEGMGTKIEKDSLVVVLKDSGNKGASASDLFVRAPKEAGVKVGGNPSRDLENNIASPAPFPAQVGEGMGTKIEEDPLVMILEEKGIAPGMSEEAITSLMTRNKDEIFRDIKANIIKRLDGLYGIDKELQKDLLAGAGKARQALTEQLEKANRLTSSMDRLTLLDLLVEQLGIRNDVEKRLLSDEIIWVYGRTAEGATSSNLFRVFLWEDVLNDLRMNKQNILLGFDFGKPFRSRNLEILGWAAGEWGRDGWLAIHNSYLDMIYRAGLVGVMCIIFIGGAIAGLCKAFFHLHSTIGLLLIVALVDWLVMANFMDILEMPYHAISFWSLMGMTLAYCQQLQNKGT